MCPSTLTTFFYTGRGPCHLLTSSIFCQMYLCEHSLRQLRQLSLQSGNFHLLPVRPSPIHFVCILKDTGRRYRLDSRSNVEAGDGWDPKMSSLLLRCPKPTTSALPRVNAFCECGPFKPCELMNKKIPRTQKPRGCVCACSRERIRYCAQVGRSEVSRFLLCRSSVERTSLRDSRGTGTRYDD